jgi:gliding motility-associated-like protein
MKHKGLRYFPTVLMVLSALAMSIIGHSQVLVETGISAEDLVIQYLLGDGVDASNVQLTGSPAQTGRLTNGNTTDFPLDAGIVLSSADAVNLQEGFGDSGTGATPDIDLLDIANSVPPLINQTFTVSNINDLCALEFDFVATGDSISFNYSFGSDEYLTYVNTQFNDIFAFFLSGPGITGPFASPPEFPDGSINIAEVPNSDPTLPITISSVNNVLNAEYYVDNPLNEGILINGYTTTFTAEAGGLECGETYHIRLAIADCGDGALESVVVIEEGSFQSNSIAIESGANNPPELGLSDDEVLEGCSSGIYTVFRPNVMELDTVDVVFSGDAENGVDFEFIDVDAIYIDETGFVEIELIPLFDDEIEGPEDVTITYTYLDGCGDEQVASATITILDYIGMELDVEDVFICPGTTETVNATPDNGQNPFVYDWSNSASGSSETFGDNDAGDYMVTIIDFCDSTITRDFVVVVPEPFSGEILEDDFCVGTTADISVSGGTIPFTFTYPQDSLTFVEPGGFEADEEGIYDITITDQCGETVDLELIFENCFTIIPNVFSPNSDGQNDMFFIAGIQGYPGSSLKVYNRWGNLVYENPNYNNTWDGEEYPEGTYYYSFERSDKVTFSGHFSLLRK